MTQIELWDEDMCPEAFKDDVSDYYNSKTGDIR
jgi:hypothetical protein